MSVLRRIGVPMTVFVLAAIPAVPSAQAVAECASAEVEGHIGPQHLVADETGGDLYVTYTSKMQIGRIHHTLDLPTNEITVEALVGTGVGGPHRILLWDDAVWFSLPAGNQVGTLPLGTDDADFFPDLPDPSKLFCPVGIEVGGQDGRLYIGEPDYQALHRGARL